MDHKHYWWVAFMPDLRGYTNEFMCSNCGAITTMGSYAKECDYTYCPYCGVEMDTEFHSYNKPPKEDDT